MLGLLALPPSSLAAAESDGLVGVYPEDVRASRDQVGLQWLPILDRWLKEHRRITGQSFRFEILNQATPAVPDQALARQTLIKLPFSLSERTDACVILGSFSRNPKGTVESHGVSIECGLGLSSILDHEQIQVSAKSLEDARFEAAEWEAHLFWLGLEILSAAGSPVIAPEGKSIRREEELPAALRRLIIRWVDSHALTRPDGSPLEFEITPADWGQGSSEINLKSLITDILSYWILGFLVVVLGFFGVLAKNPSYIITAGGVELISTRIRLFLKLKHIYIDVVKRLKK